MANCRSEGLGSHVRVVAQEIDDLGKVRDCRLGPPLLPIGNARCPHPKNLGKVLGAQSKFYPPALYVIA